MAIKYFAALPDGTFSEVNIPTGYVHAAVRRLPDGTWRVLRCYIFAREAEARITAETGEIGTDLFTCPVVTGAEKRAAEDAAAAAAEPVAEPAAAPAMQHPNVMTETAAHLIATRVYRTAYAEANAAGAGESAARAAASAAARESLGAELRAGGMDGTPLALWVGLLSLRIVIEDKAAGQHAGTRTLDALELAEAEASADNGDL